MVENRNLGHIAFIMDGNRRYAARSGISKLAGHKKGAEKLGDVITWCHEFKIKELTVYAFSTENFGRPKDEKEYLFDIFLTQFSKLSKDYRIDEYGIKINILGNLKSFSDKIQEKCAEIVELTNSNNKLILNIAFGYNGRDEIVESCKRISRKVKRGEIDVSDINENVVSQNLYTSSEPDLIVRTSGEQRLSGFLLWQSSYSEILFVEKMWPALTREDFKEIVTDFNTRNRRFGK